MAYKAIFKGQLEFGTQRSFDQAQKMFLRRAENYYKNDLLFLEEEIFNAEALRVDIGKKIFKGCLGKSWMNTTSMFEYLAQFALSGSILTLQIDEETRRIRKKVLIEPSGDRVAVLQYKRGIKLFDQGRLAEAIDAYTTAIDKFEKHTNAYENRGHVHFILKDYDKALADYSSSIAAHAASCSGAYLGRARILLMRDQAKEALLDLESTTKYSIPHEPNYWDARYLKGETLFSLKNYKAAAQEFKFFINRNIDKTEPNYLYVSIALFKWGKCLLELGQDKEALEAFDKLMKMELRDKSIKESTVYFYRGTARHRVGKRGYNKDWKTAQKLGEKRASKMLQEFC